MNYETSHTFPKPGTTLTYAEALAAYDQLESSLVAQVYNSSFAENVKAYDLLWHLQSLAEKQGLQQSGVFRDLRDGLYQFATERTALANGVNGKRFYLQKNPEVLAEHDATHLFTVGIDGAKLQEKLQAFIGRLTKESRETDEYADTYCPDWPEEDEALERVAAKERRNWNIMVGVLVVLAVIMVGASIAHHTFGVAALGKWVF